MVFEVELAAKAQIRWALAAVENVCGLAARRIVAEHLRRAPPIKLNLIDQVLSGIDTDIRLAYLIIDVLASPSYVRSLWPTTTIDARDVRNKFRSLCPDTQNASVSGWGYRCTYNPKLDHGRAFPLLVHAFGAQKEVSSTDAGWSPFFIGDGSAPGKSIARPVLRSLANPGTIVHLVLSCSLLSTAKCSTASPIGWVLNAPVWNIYGFAPRDIQFPNDNARKMGSLEQAKGIGRARNNLALIQAYDAYPDLQGLINQTEGTGSDSGYNEIVVLGTSKLFGTVTTVTGIFVKVCNYHGANYLVDALDPSLYGIEGLGERSSFYKDDSVIDAVKTCARTHGLPIVPIVDQHRDMLDRRTERLFDETFAGLTIASRWDC